MRLVSSSLSLAFSSLLLVAACDGRGGGGGDGEGGGGTYATEISIEKVVLYQGSGGVLMNNQEEESPDAVIVADRPALIRAFVYLHDDWVDREIRAQLTLSEMELDDDDEWTVASTKRIEETLDVVITSTEDSRSSTFNFEVDAEDMVEGKVGYRIDLYEVDGEEGEGEGSEKSPHWPDPGDDPAEFEPRSSGEQLRIVFLPLEYRYDGSARLPDTSDSQIERYRDGFMAQYPTAEVDITVEDPTPWSNPIWPNGSGFDRVLDYLYNIRDRYDYDVYLYALHAPSPSYGDFCQGGCVAGLSSLAQRPDDFWARVSTGLGYSGDATVGTTVHEVGHAHGREHAPCNVSGDRDYPYSGGSIGVWGYDIVRKTFKSPNLHADFMGYCDPTWVSDYTFNELFDRIRSVNRGRRVENIEALPTFRTMMIGVDGDLSWSRDIQLPALTLSDDTKAVELLDADGVVVGTVDARFTGFSHVGGGFLHIPDFDDHVASVRLAEHGTLAVAR